MKDYEIENELQRKLRHKKIHQNRRNVELEALKRNFDRLNRTYESEKEVYENEMKSRLASITQVDEQIKDLEVQLLKFKPKPKIKKKVIKTPAKNGKVACDICGKEYSKKGIKGHRKACLKKQEYEKAREEYEKLQLEETLEELDQQNPEIKLDKEKVVFIEEPNEGD